MADSRDRFVKLAKTFVEMKDVEEAKLKFDISSKYFYVVSWMQKGEGSRHIFMEVTIL